MCRITEQIDVENKNCSQFTEYRNGKWVSESIQTITEDYRGIAEVSEAKKPNQQIAGERPRKVYGSAFGI